MLTKLRIIFTILSALCIAAVIPLGAFFGFPVVVLCVLGALIFFGLMLICKNRAAEKEHEQSQPTAPPTENQGE